MEDLFMRVVKVVLFEMEAGTHNAAGTNIFLAFF